MLNIEKVSATEEKRIAIGFIVSTEFSVKISNLIKPDYITNPHLSKVISWCLAYFEEYGKAPYMHIRDIFESEKVRLKEEETELIGKLLENLDQQFDEDSLNVDYWVETTTDYFRKRELEIALNNIEIYKEKGDLTLAEEEIQNFQKVSVDLDSGNIIDMSDIEVMDEIYKKRDEEEKNFFQLPGDLGRYLGNYKRKDVVGYFAAAKKGKCLSGDNIVYLNDGTTRTVKEIVENKITKILCMDKKHNIVPGKAVDWIFSGEKTEYKTTTKTGREIKTSKEHRFYTPEGWKKLEELKKGDFIALSKKIKVKGKLSKDEKLIKIIAYLLADGHIGKKSIGFTKGDKDMREDFISCLSYLGNTHYFVRNVPDCVWLHKGPVTKFLDQVGLTGKLSGDKFIPDFIMKTNDHILSLFLRILFSCDGSIWEDKGRILIDYSSKSERMIKQICVCLSRFGIVYKLKSNIVNGTKYYEILLSNQTNTFKFLDKIGFCYEKKKRSINLLKGKVRDCKRNYVDVIPYKLAKKEVIRLVEEGVSVKEKNFQRPYQEKKHVSRYSFGKEVGFDNHLLNSDLLWDRITKIEKGKKVQMYDISMEKNHNFIAESFIVHNSWLLVDHLKHAILQRRKSMFWSVEMTETEIVPRTVKSFYPSIDGEEGFYPYPVFDCIKNQTGECKWRKSSVIVLDKEGDLFQDENHIPCTKCRNHTDKKKRDMFKCTVYEQKIYRPRDDIFSMREAHNRFKEFWKKYVRVSVHPKYSLTYDKMMRDLDIVERKYNFFPDILFLDYIDILDIGSKYDDYREDDEKWKLLAKIAGATNTLVITVTQANKMGQIADSLDSTMQGGFYGKNRHVNLMGSLNQKKEEKEKGIIRIGITEARSQHFIPGKECIVLQDIKTGQTYLDSHY